MLQNEQIFAEAAKLYDIFINTPVTITFSYYMADGDHCHLYSNDPITMEFNEYEAYNFIYENTLPERLVDIAETNLLLAYETVENFYNNLAQKKNMNRNEWSTLESCLITFRAQDIILGYNLYI